MIETAPVVLSIFGTALGTVAATGLTARRFWTGRNDGSTACGGSIGELARHQEVREDLVRVAGRLREVSNLDADTVWITVDRLKGLEERELLTATIKRPAPETDAVLEQIGHNGPITLEGRARNTPDRLGALHMHEVRRINEHVVPATGTPVRGGIGRLRGEAGDVERVDFTGRPGNRCRTGGRPVDGRLLG